MMMNFLTGLAIWMAVSVALGLVFGRVMHGYAVNQLPVPVPLAEPEELPSYKQAA